MHAIQSKNPSQAIAYVHEQIKQYQQLLERMQKNNDF